MVAFDELWPLLAHKHRICRAFHRHLPSRESNTAGRVPPFVGKAHFQRFDKIRHSSRPTNSKTASTTHSIVEPFRCRSCKAVSQVRRWRLQPPGQNQQRNPSDGGERQELVVRRLGSARRGAAGRGELIRWLETFRTAPRRGRGGDISPHNQPAAETPSQIFIGRRGRRDRTSDAEY